MEVGEGVIAQNVVVQHHVDALVKQSMEAVVAAILNQEGEDVGNTPQDVSLQCVVLIMQSPTETAHIKCVRADGHFEHLNRFCCLLNSSNYRDREFS